MKKKKVEMEKKQIVMCACECRCGHASQVSLLMHGTGCWRSVACAWGERFVVCADRPRLHIIQDISCGNGGG